MEMDKLAGAESFGESEGKKCTLTFKTKQPRILKFGNILESKGRFGFGLLVKN